MEYYAKKTKLLASMGQRYRSFASLFSLFFSCLGSSRSFRERERRGGDLLVLGY